MAKRDFDREMEAYISAKRKGKPFSFKDFISKIIPKHDETVDVPEDVEVYVEQEEIKAEPVEKKEPWLKRIFSIKKEKEEPEPEVEYKLLAEDAVADLKFLTKVTLENIKNLPPDKIKEFKKSDDFDKLKKILKKHELIK